MWNSTFKHSVLKNVQFLKWSFNDDDDAKTWILKTCKIVQVLTNQVTFVCTLENSLFMSMPARLKWIHLSDWQHTYTQENTNNF